MLYQDEIFDGFAYGDIQIYYGMLNLVLNFTGFDVVDERTGVVTGQGGDSEAHYQNNLHGFWINLPPGEFTADGIGAFDSRGCNVRDSCRSI